MVPQSAAIIMARVHDFPFPTEKPRDKRTHPSSSPALLIAAVGLALPLPFFFFFFSSLITSPVTHCRSQRVSTQQ
jgi:hypothetical protein